MNIANHQRLSFRLARNTVLLALILGVTMSCIQVTSDFRNENASIDQEINAIVSIVNAPAARIAYNIDAGLADELLIGLLKHPAIITAEISDTEQRSLASRQKPAVESPYRWISDLLFKANRRYSSKLFAPQLRRYLLGHLNIVADTFPSGAQFLQRSALTLVAGFIRSLVLSVFLLILFYLMLTAPLLRVIKGVSEADSRKTEKIRLPIPHGHEKDEIGVLVTSTNMQFQAIEDNLESVKKAESRLATYSEQLENTVNRRTEELSQKNKALIKSNHDLREAKEDAVRREKSRANFFASMSHEIRTPFNGVLGMIGLTLEEPLSAKQKEQLNIAYRSGLTLLELLNDVLDISKVEAGKLTLEAISFDLRKIVQDIASLMAQNAHSKKIDLFIHVDVDFPERVVGDPTRIRQVISNLVSNGIKFTEQGHVAIKLTMGSDGRTEIDVNDTGIGIDNQHLDSIFSAFSQGNQTTTRKYGGTGLGLTLCKYLINKMNGQLSFNSEPGVGSSFQIKLPLQPDPSVHCPAIDLRLKQQRYLLIHSEENQSFHYMVKQLRHWGMTADSISFSQPNKLSVEQQHLQQASIIIFDSIATLTKLSGLQQGGQIGQPILVLLSRHCTTTELTPLQKGLVQHITNAPLGRDKLYQLLCSVLGVRAEIKNKVSQQKAKYTIQNKPQVLLVEDNHVNQIVATTILQKLNCQVTTASNGQEALEKIRRNEFAIVLMDCHMPVMNGYEATRLIRQQSSLRDLPVIAVTANVLEGDKEKCFACGMNDYLNKPYERDLLAEKLAKWLASRSSTSHHSASL